MDIKKKSIYRVVFAGQDKVYELLVRQLFQSDMVDFLEVEEIILPDDEACQHDSATRQLRDEFSYVKRSYIPMHAILRIDEIVEKAKMATVEQLSFKTSATSNVAPFPSRPSSNGDSSNQDGNE